MAANVTSMSLSFAATTPSLLGVVSSSSKRLLPFSALPYPSFSLRTSNPNRAVVDGQTAIVQEQPNDVVFAPEEEEQQPRKLRNATQLYVCNLPRTYDTQQLFDLFSPHGTVLSAQVCRNVETGQSKGSAYVKMGSYNAAKNAVAALDGLDVEGREMRVKFSVQMNTKKNFVETFNTMPLKTLFYEGPHKVYVGNLSKTAAPEDLRHLFGKFGNVASVRVLQDLKLGKNRVYAFVSYLSQSERDAAMSLNGTEFSGRILVIRGSTEKPKT
ncbi:RNA-binding (RRM/RBD/RNP motifs) family protein [Trifolium repens]|nr:RNA-binding (RRM/RBD/RNP motifs) family protein [Trifolium repens]